MEKIQAVWLKGEKIFLTESQIAAMNEHAIEKAGNKKSETEDHAYQYLIDQGLHGKKTKTKKGADL